MVFITFFHPVVRQIPLSRASRGSCADPAWRGAFKVVWPMQEPPINRIAWKSMLQQAQLVYGKLWSLWFFQHQSWGHARLVQRVPTPADVGVNKVKSLRGGGVLTSRVQLLLFCYEFFDHGCGFTICNTSSISSSIASVWNHSSRRNVKSFG